MAESLQRLSRVVEEACSSNDRGAMSSARDAWLLAKTAWDRAQLASYFGPADMLRTVSKVDYEPVSSEGIEELLASGTTIDFEYVDDKIAATSRGLGSIEYLLFGAGGDEPGVRQCELAVASARVAAAAASDLEEAWTGPSDGSPSFAFILTDDMKPDMALANVVGAIVETLKRQSLFELGKALGETSAEPQPEAIPEGAAGAGAERYLAQLEGIRGAIDAGGKQSLGALIGARSSDVAADIDGLLAAATASLGSVDGPITAAVDRQRDLLESIYGYLSDLTVLFEADVVSLLDITLGFSDADGDTG